METDKESITGEETLQVSVNVQNVGDVEGTETLQLYIHDIAASVVRPVKELKGFQKVTLKPGQEEKVSFEIGAKQLQFLTENDRWESEPGEFEVFVGTDSSTVNGVKFWLR